MYYEEENDARRGEDDFGYSEAHVPLPLEMALLQSPEHSDSFWRRTFSKVAGFQRKAIRIFLNGKEYFARPDSRSDQDIMTLAFAKENGFQIRRSKGNKGLFQLGNGKLVSSIGMTCVPLKLLGHGQSEERRWFHVLAKCAVPLIMGNGILKKIDLYRANKHLLVDCPFSFGSLPTLKWLGSIQGGVAFTANGRELKGHADTGSDLEFMSLRCAIQKGFKIDRRHGARTRVMLADGTEVETVGQVRISSVKISQFEGFEMSFHVLAGLPCEVIFSEEFVEQMDLFDIFPDLIDSEDVDLYTLNTLVNLGPLQALLNRKWRKKESLSAQQEHDSVVEAETYRRNKANRKISKMEDAMLRLAALEAEENRRTEFDRRHQSCAHCTRQEIGS